MFPNLKSIEIVVVNLDHPETTLEEAKAGVRHNLELLSPEKPLELIVTESDYQSYSLS